MGHVAAVSPGGRKLWYLAGDQIMAVAFTTIGESFEAQKPRVWASREHDGRFRSSRSFVGGRLLVGSRMRLHPSGTLSADFKSASPCRSGAAVVSGTP
jgi:hypothetical protein